jgi:hypothetical protein
MLELGEKGPQKQTGSKLTLRLACQSIVGFLCYVAHVGMCKAGKDLEGKSRSRVTMTEKRLGEEMIKKAKEMGRY